MHTEILEQVNDSYRVFCLGSMLASAPIADVAFTNRWGGGMTKFMKFVAAASLLASSLFAAPAAFAGWVITQGCGGCGPTTTVEFFIVGDTGAGPFAGPGLSTLPAGWVANLVNPNYVIASGPSVNLSGWTENYLGNIADSVEVDLFFWAGAPLQSTISFAANYTRTGGGLSLHCQSFGAGCNTMDDPTGVNYNRSGVLPEPATLALVGMSLLGLASSRRRRA
ncbi:MULTISPECIES: PEP-CTERM sorting domain-containing protein [unclassified Roseateles]|uniref:PEP-CTERM sorting domain-containing protein n=1 Tax=Pelomonas sp. Root1237 TaxID=1736434 RepID=UPI0009EB38BC|nr:PEP-CTERM sorting domain-containing protein [Pelomonas sp. Root1237]